MDSYYLTPATVSESLLSSVFAFVDDFYSLLLLFFLLAVACWWVVSGSHFRPELLTGNMVLSLDFLKVMNAIIVAGTIAHLIRFRSPFDLFLFAFLMLRTTLLLYRGHVFAYLLIDLITLAYNTRRFCLWHPIDPGGPLDPMVQCASLNFFSSILTSIGHGSTALINDWMPFTLFSILLASAGHIHFIAGAPMTPMFHGTAQPVEAGQNVFGLMLFAFFLTFYLARMTRGLLHNFRVVFSRYVSTPVAEELLSDPSRTLAIGGDRRHVVILLSDLRGFSSLLSSMEPEDAIKLMNRYLEDMLAIIPRHGGTVDEIIGDALLVIFGLQNRTANDWDADEAAAASAVRCAAEMQRAMVRHPGLSMGIGIHSGDVVVGNIGSMSRCKFGIIGAAINMAARIESFSLRQQVVISDDLIAELPPNMVRLSGRRVVHPKGAPASGLGIALVDAVDGEPICAEPTPGVGLPIAVTEPVSVYIALLAGGAKEEVGGFPAKITHIDSAVSTVRLAHDRVDVDLRPDNDVRFRLGTDHNEVLGRVTAVAPTTIAITYVADGASKALKKLKFHAKEK